MQSGRLQAQVCSLTCQCVSLPVTDTARHVLQAQEQSDAEEGLIALDDVIPALGRAAAIISAHSLQHQQRQQQLHLLDAAAAAAAAEQTAAMADDGIDNEPPAKPLLASPSSPAVNGHGSAANHAADASFTAEELDDALQLQQQLKGALRVALAGTEEEGNIVMVLPTSAGPPTSLR